MSNAAIMREIAGKEVAQRQMQRSNFVDYAKAVAPELEFTPFHTAYYSVLDKFAHGEIKKLIITVPPQHGKSQGSTVLLPSYILGIAPDTRIAIASYSASLACKFSRRVQMKIDDKPFARLFPTVRLPTPRDRGYTRTAGEFEIVGNNGSLMAVGREGALTGNKVDIFILDDLYKDSMEGNSPVVRSAVLEWYSSVVRTRQHNDSRELIVFTRWHEEDLIGDILNREGARELTSVEDIDPTYTGFYILNYEAIKESEPTELDPRQRGQLLWENRHGAERLIAERTRNPYVFQCLYQGNPTSAHGLLYGAFNLYYDLPPSSEIVKIANYTDTADMGSDYLCSICYVKDKQGRMYVTDVVYTNESMEVTEPMVSKMLRTNDTRIAHIESNNGGRGFARAVQRLTPDTKVEWFSQSANKEARILTNSATVVERIIMPHDWAQRWESFHYDVTTYKRDFKANRRDDAPDTLTGMVEKEQRRKGLRKYGLTEV